MSFSWEVPHNLRETCVEISKQSKVRYWNSQFRPSARMVFRNHPEAKKVPWGSEFWTGAYFVNTDSMFGNERAISK
ncbi:hypothetical protein [Flagellimonas baculiformis]|uniref:hypothetical protein n=1 Tax=Flagellimonas baculiformis TaxID=3067310 RepID=UPI00296E87BA|nr:hypothetical protein [Muricauda sp. D6]